MSLLMKTATNAYWASPNLVPLIGLTMVRQSVRHGNSGLSAYGYVLYGLIASAVLFGRKRRYRFGALAMDVLDQFGARHLVGKTALVHHGFIRHGVDPMAICGRAVLELPRSTRCRRHRERRLSDGCPLCTAVVSGEPLPTLTERLAPYVDAVRASGHEQTIYGTSVSLPAVDNLRADDVEPVLRARPAHRLRPAVGRDARVRAGQPIPQGVCATECSRSSSTMSAPSGTCPLLFASMRSTPGQAYLMPCLGMYTILLARKRAARRASPADRAKLVAIIRLLERRAKTNAHDHRPFLDLIAAERAAGAGRLDAAARFLDTAGSAAASGFTYLEGLALERAATLRDRYAATRETTRSPARPRRRRVAAVRRHGASTAPRARPDRAAGRRLVDRRRHPARHRRRGV